MYKNFLVHHPSLQNHHGPLKPPDHSRSTRTTTGPQTLLQVHSNQSWLLHAYRSQSITPELPWTSQSLPDHSKQPGHSPGLPALFQTNHPGRTFMATPYLSQGFKIINSSPITQDPLWTSQSLPEPLWSTKSTTRPPNLFQVHSNLSWLLHAYSSHSRPSLPSPITPELS